MSTPAWRHSFLGPAGTPLAVLKTAAMKLMTRRVQLADNGNLDWQCDYRAAFHGDPGQLADMIVPILRALTPGDCGGW